MATIADDKFKIYYQEKMWELIPGSYRHEDGLPENPNPHVLRALVEVMAEQAAIIRRSQDRLWEDQFIELCNDWAVPYIGDLLGTRLLSALNKRGRRIDVAKTIYYRRRKGTPRILEELIYDVSEWDGKLVEAFQRLARARHGLDPKPTLFPGRFTGTLPGGVADLRNPAGSELADGPFEEYFHTPDFRKPKGLDGRYGIPKLIFYLYRLFSYPVTDASSFVVTDEEFMFDPSGRDIPLFAMRKRPKRNGWEDWHSALEWELPAPIRCRLLGNAEYKVTEEPIQALAIPVPVKDGLRKLTHWRFHNEEEFITALQNVLGLPALMGLDPSLLPTLLRLFIADDCGKNQLLPDSISVSADAPIRVVPKEDITAASLKNWTANTDKKLAIDAERGRFLFLIDPDKPANVSGTYHYGFSGPYGAGTYERLDVEDSEPTLQIIAPAINIDPAAFLPTETVQVNDNRTYNIISNAAGIKALVMQAANQQRPYLLLTDHLIFASGGNDATLVLDGLWFGAPGDKQFNIILQGDYECVIIRNCTLDPGGSVNAKGETIHHVSLVVEGTIEKLCIEKSILGPIIIDNDGLLEEEMMIIDSIVQSVAPALHAIEITSGKVDILRTTIFGTIDVHRLYASDTIITGLATVTDTQSGCFRFSAAPVSVGGIKSRLPRPYESFLFKKDTNHWFTSREFGQPGYAQLSDTAPAAIYRGGENGAEMGVFNGLLNIIKYDGLKTKVEEYMPFGLIPAFINVTYQPKP